MTTTMSGRPHPHLQRLVDYIVQKLSDHEGTAARTRLAKLLYLFDIEYYRVHGHPFTRLQWRFLHYGPYDTALEPYLGSDEATTTSGHRAYVARGSYEDVSVDDILTLSDRMILDRVVQQWGPEDSAGAARLRVLWDGADGERDTGRGAGFLASSKSYAKVSGAATGVAPPVR